MCLTVMKLEPEGGIRWKLVERRADNTLYSPFQPHFVWQLGVNKSGRSDRRLHPNEWSQVRQGIHVFVRLEDAMTQTVIPDHGFFNRFTLRLLRVRCLPEHFVAAGNWESRADSAVYTEVENLGLYTGND